MEGQTETLPRRRGSSVVQFAVFAMVLGLLALFAVGLIDRNTLQVERGAAPQFSIPQYSGGAFLLAQQRGKVVVVNFWASWCVPCRDEAPILESAWRAYQERGVVFVGVDYVDTPEAARAFIQEFDITYPNGPDIGTAASQAYHIQGVPETYFVGKDGQLYGNYIGPIDAATLSAKIEELLKK